MVNFKNTIIIMTSNLGGEYIHEMASLGFAVNKKNKLEQQKEELKEKIHESLTERFRPEFLNRIDEIIIFDSLSNRDIEKIVDLQVEKINRRLTDKKIFIQLTQEAKKYLSQKGFSPDYGARPLKRLIEKEILDRLADEIIIGEIKEGKKISVSLKKNSLSLCQR
jgi:ATP-dependent Clp protease ATP-binding subunit ClpC